MGEEQRDVSTGQDEHGAAPEGAGHNKHSERTNHEICFCMRKAIGMLMLID